MSRKNTVVLLAAALLGGCATGYHSIHGLSGYTGGYWEDEGPGELTKVNFAANGYSDNSTVQDYLLLRCAEVAKAKGKPYFRMYGSIAEAIVERKIRTELVSTVTNGPYGYAYVLFEDQAGKDTLETAEVLQKYAHIKNHQETAKR
jgi:hypothetical protein